MYRNEYWGLFWGCLGSDLFKCLWNAPIFSCVLFYCILQMHTTIYLLCHQMWSDKLNCFQFGVLTNILLHVIYKYTYFCIHSVLVVTSEDFSRVAKAVYIFIISTQEFQFIPTLANTCYPVPPRPARHHFSHSGQCITL